MKLDIEYTDDAESQYVKCALVGFAGSGKTRSASTLPGRTLVISAEAGTRSLADFHIAYVNINSDKIKNSDGTVIHKPLSARERITKLGSILKYLRESNDYDNIYIDSITEISEQVLECVQIEFPDRKDSFPMWGEYGKRMRSIIKQFRDLQGYNVFMTCLAEYDQDENKRRFISCDVMGKIGKQLPQFFDEVLYTYVNAENEFRYFTKKTETGVAKDRSGKLDADMPADLGLVMLKINEKKKPKEKEKK